MRRLAMLLAQVGGPAIAQPVTLGDYPAMTTHETASRTLGPPCLYGRPEVLADPAVGAFLNERMLP